MIRESAGSAWCCGEEMAWESPSSPRHAREFSVPHADALRRVPDLSVDRGLWLLQAAFSGRRESNPHLELGRHGQRRTSASMAYRRHFCMQLVIRHASACALRVPRSVEEEPMNNCLRSTSHAEIAQAAISGAVVVQRLPRCGCANGKSGTRMGSTSKRR